MESRLEDLSKSFPWLNSILEKIKEEPFRSQFYTNFRKDFTKYSIITVKYNKQGDREYVVQIINTKGAVQTVLEEITSAFGEGVMGNIIKADPKNLNGGGKLNLKNVVALETLRSGIF